MRQIWMKSVYALSFLFYITNGWADVNLLDIMKANRHSFETSESCRKFIQAADHSTLKSSEISKLMVPLSSLDFKDDYFFHYSDDAGKELRAAVANKDFSPIVNYLMKYKGALGNVRGPGLYVAANPFSSSNYGSFQFMLMISPSSKVFNYHANSRKVSQVINEFASKLPGFSSCYEKVRVNLLLEENGADMIRYEYENFRSEEWLVVLNEEIIKDSSYAQINSNSHDVIIKKMVNNNSVHGLIGLVKEINPNRYHAMDFKNISGHSSFTEENILAVSQVITHWDQTNAQFMAQIISKASQPDLDKLINRFSKSQIPLPTFERVSLEETSSDFKTWFIARLKKNPQIFKTWGSTLYVQNMNTLIKLGLYSSKDYVTYATDFDQIKNLFNNRTSLNLKPEAQAMLAEDVMRSPFYKDIDQETRYSIFNTFMHLGKEENIPGLIPVLNNAGYPLPNSFNYLKSKNPFNISMTAQFFQSYIEYTNNPELLDDTVMRIVGHGENKNLKDFYPFIFKNQQKLGQNGQKYVSWSLKTISSQNELASVITPSHAKHLNAETKELVTDLVFGHNGPQDIVKKDIANMVGVFGYTSEDLLELVKKKLSLVSSTAMEEVIPYFERNQSIINELIDLSKTTRTKDILANEKYLATSKYLMAKYHSQFMNDINLLPNLPMEVGAIAFDPSRLKGLISDYSPADQWKAITQMKKFNSGDHLDVVRKVSFDTESAKEVIKFLKNSKESFETYESLINTKGFISKIDVVEFEWLFKQIATFKTELNLKVFWSSGVVDFDRALVLFRQLKIQQGEYNLRFLLEEHLKFSELSNTQRDSLMKNYISSYSSIDGFTLNHVAKELYPWARKEQKTNYFVPLFKKLSIPEKNEVFEYYLASSGLIDEGKNIFSQNDLSFTKEVLLTMERELIAGVLANIEANYSSSEVSAYAPFFVENYHSQLKDIPEAKDHMRNFLCKKVNKYNAFAELIGDERDKNRKRELKESRKYFCI